MLSRDRPRSGPVPRRASKVVAAAAGSIGAFHGLNFVAPNGPLRQGNAQETSNYARSRLAIPALAAEQAGSELAQGRVSQAAACAGVAAVAYAVASSVGSEKRPKKSKRASRVACADGASAGTKTRGKLSAAMCAEPPFKCVIIYNQSKHASQSVLADIRAVWGQKIRVIQCLEEGLDPLPNVDLGLYLKPQWGDMEHFQQRLELACTQDHRLFHHRQAREVVFMPGWSAFAESADAAIAVEKMGLVWPGTEPVASRALEKIGFKRFCKEVGAPTPPFCVLSEEEAGVDLGDEAKKEECIKEFMKKIADMKTSQAGLIKSVHGGGGKGTAPLDDPSDPEQVRASISRVLNEMKRSDGIYFEEKVNTKGDGRFVQLELEVDGEKCADGGRFVWFNSRFQKVVEIGLQDDLVEMFMPKDLYQKSRQWAIDVAKISKNNTRATIEGLVFQNEKGEHEVQFIECNRRPQVENEALALLQQDSAGNRRYTFGELMMRAKGYEAPDFAPADPDIKAVMHLRWLHGNPDNTGTILYQPGTVLGMDGPRLDYVAAELLSPGEISFTADPQLGKAVIVADSWNQMCDRIVEYLALRMPMVQGSVSTYATAMSSLFDSKEWRAGKVASNETFKYIKIPDFPPRGLKDILQDQVGPVLVNGYRTGDGIDADRWPTPSVLSGVVEVGENMAAEVPKETAFARFAEGRGTYEDYIKELRGQLSDQGGAWVTVAPRDTAQQCADSESAGIQSLSRQNAEVWAQRAGCVGYEVGGAQYQAGLIRGFDPATILKLGLPYNMPAHSLQRSQYVNGLTELTPEVRKGLFAATSQIVTKHYRRFTQSSELLVPWLPYNFHAGNYYDEATGYSSQDQTTTELLDASCVPMPCWVFSPKFPLEELTKWTNRQIDIFDAKGLKVHALRIKNPGQGVDWTAEAVWNHVKTMIAVFEGRKLQTPIFYIHNHDFNGLASHVGRELLQIAQKNGFSDLVVDAAYRKNGSHNDNTIISSVLTLTREQKEALAEYNFEQQRIQSVLTRFDSSTSQMTPWDSDWAGGTEGSDLRIAREYNINSRLINGAKEVATEVFPIERAVTPFSEYKLRLGIGILIEPGIEPKTAEAVRAWVNKGGKIKVGGDVLVGLKRWETLVPKTKEVDKLLDNMKSELDDAMNQKKGLVTPGDLPKDFTPEQIHNALGYQQKGFDFAKLQAKGADLTPLLTAPHVLHSQPRTLKPGTRFEVLQTGTSNVSQRSTVGFVGFGTAPNGDIKMGFLHKGKTLEVQLPDPDAAVSAGAASGPRKANATDPNQLGAVVAGEMLAYAVSPGDVLKEGDPMCTLESMKMEMKFTVPAEFDGKKVKTTPLTSRTKEAQGTLITPGDLILEVE